ncbi:hypothetical protein [Phenylobacterium sp.]|uniref:hypothetical protein n=1 Tax=Phenylobacterium sp. TaxID=1871053 RepID=UPI00272F7B6E|nr:hypothetical protein [Phenylobacterium sp.]MDP1599021.1 hypothetical protein [Phenylobacterium sp.]MDP3590449.1 hypothetical protein [Phenylobacterium sp.]
MADLGERERLAGRSRPEREQIVDEVFTSVDSRQREVRNVGAQVGLVLKSGETGN